MNSKPEVGYHGILTKLANYLIEKSNSDSIIL